MKGKTAWKTDKILRKPSKSKKIDDPTSQAKTTWTSGTLPLGSLTMAMVLTHQLEQTQTAVLSRGIRVGKGEGGCTPSHTCVQIVGKNQL